MTELDEKIYAYIKNIGPLHYYGRALPEIEKKFARQTKEPFQADVWAALSRLSQAKRIKKSGSHRYKGYVVADITTRDTVK